MHWVAALIETSRYRRIWGFCMTHKLPVLKPLCELHWFEMCRLSTTARTKWARISICWTSKEILGYVPVNLAGNRSTLTVVRVVIQSTSTGITGGGRSREGRLSAKLRMSVSSASLQLLTVLRLTLFRDKVCNTPQYFPWGLGQSPSQLSSSKQRDTPWTGHQTITGPEKQTHLHSHSLLRTILKSPQTWRTIFWDRGSGRKPEYPEKTHAHTVWTSELYSERLQQSFKP